MASYSFEGYFIEGHTCINGVREFKYLGYFIKNKNENFLRFTPRGELLERERETETEKERQREIERETEWKLR